MATLGSRGDGPTNLMSPRGLCFTDAGMLLVADCANSRMQHWTLEGQYISSFSIQYPQCAARCLTLHSDIIAIGTIDAGVSACSLADGTVLHSWLVSDVISAVAFIIADTLVVSNFTQEMIGLYTLDGSFLKQIAIDIFSFGIVVCVDDCILMSDFHQSRMRTFTLNGTELDTSQLVTHTFQSSPTSVALHGERVYIMEDAKPGRICVFE